MQLALFIYLMAAVIKVLYKDQASNCVYKILGKNCQPLTV